ncbi:hypothetical protein BRCON_1378 [Candidatus Sumerlaea chitinivorans]|uniref:MEMO1 family protein BRCON_1378 n=1 Tax=Sumerlaea chitinivorans TaxID=2250252 RepID=A0A2Z4Y6X1_SUMC1|nr:hypothetical protein BRCON_1378 [Candidatus Sumerlaea chitinivorans]
MREALHKWIFDVRRKLHCMAVLIGVAAGGISAGMASSLADVATSGPIVEVRRPAVAGAFYPAEASKLREGVNGLLSAAACPQVPGKIRGLIVPHAGYEYSGPVAAVAYKALIGQTRATDAGSSHQRVIILAPSHYADFNGVAVTPAHYRTPLGIVNLDPLVHELATQSPFTFRPKALVEAPPWASRTGLSSQDPRPDTYEHSLEVQLPFLQAGLGEFRLVPLVCGRVDPKVVADVLAKRIGPQDVVIASSDLSHYHPYETARSLDLECVRRIRELDIRGMQQQEACGKTPILVLMHLARQFDWEPILLSYQNSGDTSGRKEGGVVGYAAIAFCERSTARSSDPKAKKGGGGDGVNPLPNEDRSTTNPTDGTTQPLTVEEGRLLVQLARRTVEEVVRFGRLPVVRPEEFPKKFHDPKGCFVTLTKHGQLRGCIGQIFPREPLYQAVMSSARSAALEDPRFSPVRPAELSELEIEVSVLTVPKPLAFSSPEDLLAKLQPHRDGVVLKIGPYMATFLPQVWEQLPRKEDFLSHLSRKAGCAADAWRGPNVEVQIYHVQAFEESQFVSRH